MNFLRKNGALVLILVLFLANIFVWRVYARENRNGILRVVFLDVGQGDAVYIEAPNGNQMLIDGGPNKKILEELGLVMPFYDRTIDVVLASHPDLDHIGGLTNVIGLYEVGALIESGAETGSSAEKALRLKSDEQKIKKFIGRKGLSVDMGRGVLLEILFPDRDASLLESNDSSLIVRLVYGKSSFIFTGDSPSKMEDYLVSLYGEKLKSGVLKVGHHGSKTSASELFFGTVSPEYAVISAGKNNRYGHPHKETVDMLNSFEIGILATYERGRVEIDSDGESYSLK